MGTRHLIAITIDGDFKLAQYGQWDGYPGGQGETVLAFLHSLDSFEEFAKQVRALRWATEEDFAKVNAAAGIGKDDEWITMEQGEALKAAAPALSRDTSAQILPMILAGSVEFVNDEREFGKDSLFCEWAYLIDLDAKTLEVYKGFQKEPPKHGRWANQPVEEGEDYFPIERVQVWSLEALPDLEDFLAILEPNEDDD